MENIKWKKRNEKHKAECNIIARYNLLYLLSYLPLCKLRCYHGENVWQICFTGCPKFLYAAITISQQLDSLRIQLPSSKQRLKYCQCGMFLIFSVHLQLSSTLHLWDINWHFQNLSPISTRIMDVVCCFAFWLDEGCNVFGIFLKLNQILFSYPVFPVNITASTQNMMLFVETVAEYKQKSEQSARMRNITRAQARHQQQEQPQPPLQQQCLPLSATNTACLTSSCTGSLCCCLIFLNHHLCPLMPMRVLPLLLLSRLKRVNHSHQRQENDGKEEKAGTDKIRKA